jgi:phage shock protein E
MYTKINMQTAKSMLDVDPNIIVIDVRTQEEYEGGHIPGSIMISYEEIPIKVPRLIRKRDAKIFVYCSSGFRSKIASLSLIKLGYTNVFDLEAISGWRYPLAK